MKAKVYKDYILVENGNMYNLQGRLLPMVNGIGGIMTHDIDIVKALIEVFGEWNRSLVKANAKSRGAVCNR